ncbi:AzlD domain-containing protein [Sphaerotilus montanus]|uniref:Branched-subunit amino acid transport protein n=1 Tax=Sphaerotilus montanus TaxID=522889 RepID=A0A7Y9UBU9_9BURK|nr:AzlD domain-containing protein [Sphaerotilus montanus]NYG32909.1 branched-subunit amino acid transport protein [Sphaerotilus montanus]NZD57722.1 AzlD domain-containing protein [Sphaerotilus montanus]
MNTWEAAITIVGLALVTVLTRSLLMLPREEVPIPAWAKRALKYAPLAALVAIIVPEVLLTRGVLIATLADARLIGAAVGLAYYFWKRGILGTIVVGMAVFLPLRIGLGW